MPRKKKNPSSAAKAVKSQRRSKARKAAKGSAKRSKAAKDVYKRKISKALAKINPSLDIREDLWAGAWQDGYELAHQAFNEQVWILPGPEPELIRGTAVEAARKLRYPKPYTEAIEQGIVEAKREQMIERQPGFVSIQEPPSPYPPEPNT